MSSLPFQIGITGGIGAGKSILCQVFASLGTPLYSADDRAKWLMNNDPELRNQIIAQFSDKAYHDQGLDRQYLAEHVFHDQAKLEVLNELVHPAVAKDYENWLVEHSFAAYVIKEAALMYETGSHVTLDKVIVVTAPEAVRINRVQKRDPQRGRDQIKAIIAKQIPVEEAIAQADFVIVNDGESLLLPEVLRLHKLFSTQRVD